MSGSRKKKKKKPKAPKARRSWVINPVTRVESSGKAYQRRKAKQEIRKQQLEDEE